MPKRVLIADDEPNIVLSLEYLLGKQGYVTSVARSGSEVLAQLAEQGADLVLLDVMMPELDGFSVLQRLREDARFGNLKVVLLTAKGREVEMRKGLALGADAYVTKPFSTRELLRQIAQLLEGS